MASLLQVLPQATINSLQAALQATKNDSVSTLLNCNEYITYFLNNPTQTNWNTMNTMIQTFMSTRTAIPGLAVLITMPDGKVAYDTRKNGTTNTYANYQAGTIEENHNTRVSIMTALLSNNGVGYESKISSTTGDYTSYQTIRIGYNPELALGCCRVSVTLPPPS